MTGKYVIFMLVNLPPRLAGKVYPRLRTTDLDLGLMGLLRQ